MEAAIVVEDTIILSFSQTKAIPISKYNINTVSE